MSNNLAKRVLSTSLTVLAFILGIVLIISVFMGIPYIFNNIGNVRNIVSEASVFIIGISFFMIIILLLRIVSSSKVSIFINKNVKRFKVIGYILFVNLVIEYISMICNGLTGMRLIDLAPGIFITPGMAIYFVSALVCFVIADAFHEAIKIKEDNELTI